MPDLPDETDAKLTFDLRRQPWIGVVREDRTRDELGLLEVLSSAHELRAISDTLPPVECGLIRLLVAFVLDIFPLRDGRDWEELWDAGRFDEPRLLKYFDEEWPDRFDLFDERYPFLQSANADGEDKPLAALLPSHSTTNSEMYFHHLLESDIAVSPAVAARLLTTIPCFAIAGGRGWSPAINGAPPWYVLLQGRNLFETILLNCCVTESLLPFAAGSAPPAWRDERPVKPELLLSVSQLEALTWRPRIVRLLPTGSGKCSLTNAETAVLINRLKFDPGFYWVERNGEAGGDGKNKKSLKWRDPHLAYRTRKDQESPVRPSEGRQIWRDIGPLALLRHSEDTGRDVLYERPAVVSQFAQFVRQRILPADTPLRLAIYGIRTKDAKVLEWQRHQLNPPAPLILEEKFHTLAEAEMKRADDIAYALAQAIKHTYPRDGKGNDKAFNTLIARAQGDFWNRLRLCYTDAPASLLHRLAPLQPERDIAEINDVLADWRGHLNRIAHKVLWDSIGDLDTDAEAIQRQVEARQKFGWRVWELLHPAEAEARKKEKSKKKGVKA